VRWVVKREESERRGGEMTVMWVVIRGIDAVKTMPSNSKELWCYSYCTCHQLLYRHQYSVKENIDWGEPKEVKWKE
jgi:hypothetical protein